MGGRQRLEPVLDRDQSHPARQPRQHRAIVETSGAREHRGAGGRLPSITSQRKELDPVLPFLRRAAFDRDDQLIDRLTDGHVRVGLIPKSGRSWHLWQSEKARFSVGIASWCAGRGAGGPFYGAQPLQPTPDAQLTGERLQIFDGLSYLHDAQQQHIDKEIAKDKASMPLKEAFHDLIVILVLGDDHCLQGVMAPPRRPTAPPAGNSPGRRTCSKRATPRSPGWPPTDRGSSSIGSSSGAPG